MTSKKLQLELRRYRGKQLRPDFVADMARRLAVSEEDITLVELGRSDQFLDEASKTAKLHPDYKQLWHADEVEEVARVLEELRTQTVDTPMLLYRRLSDYCGAVQVSLHQILRHMFSLVDLDGEYVLAYADDQKSSILFLYREEWSETGTYNVYDLRLSGELWSDRNMQA